MKIENPSIIIYTPSANPIDDLKQLERIGRTCYKSEDKITETSYDSFLRGLVLKGHHSVLEHITATVCLKTDRAVSLETVRHRLASYSQVSTRYCNYSKDKFNNEISVMSQLDYFSPYDDLQDIQLPNFNLNQHSSNINSIINVVSFKGNSFDVWLISILISEWAYITLTKQFNHSPQIARSVLPNCLATELWVTANLREWRHILSLRALGTCGVPHPDIRKIMLIVLQELYKRYPVIFEDLYNTALGKNLIISE